MQLKCNSTPLVFLIKWNIVFVTEMLEQPNYVHNVVTILVGFPPLDLPIDNRVPVLTIRDLRHAHVDKQSKVLSDVDVNPLRGAV